MRLDFRSFSAKCKFKIFSFFNFFAVLFYFSRIYEFAHKLATALVKIVASGEAKGAITFSRKRVLK